MSFIQKTVEKCSCCSDSVEVYHIPLPSTGVTFNPEDNFVLHLDRDEMQTLYLEIKEHLMGLADIQPVE